MRVVRSRDNRDFKLLRDLGHSAHARKKHDLCLLEGSHIVAMALDSRCAIQSLVVRESSLINAEAAALAARVPAERLLVLDDELFSQISTLSTPAGILALAPVPRSVEVDFAAQLVVAIDGIQDPGNAGAIMRAAAAAGASQVLLSRDAAFAWAPRTLRAAQGAHFALGVVEHAVLADVAGVFRERGGTVVALDGHATQSVWQCDLRQRVMLVVGNEGAGVSTAVMHQATRVAIPMPGRMESLNAAQAAAIALFEVVRQRAS